MFQSLLVLWWPFCLRRTPCLLLIFPDLENLGHFSSLSPIPFHLCPWIQLYWVWSQVLLGRIRQEHCCAKWGLLLGFTTFLHPGFPIKSFSDVWTHGLPYGCFQRTLPQPHPFSQPWYCPYNIYEMRAASDSAGDVTQRFSIQAQRKGRWNILPKAGSSSKDLAVCRTFCIIYINHSIAPFQSFICHFPFYADLSLCFPVSLSDLSGHLRSPAA